MLALRLLILSLCTLLGFSLAEPQPQAPSDWASAASSVAASIRQSISAAASMAAASSLSAVVLLNTTSPRTTSRGYAVASTTVTSLSSSITPSASISGVPSGLVNGTMRTSLRFPITATMNTSTVTLVTSFIPQPTVGAAPKEHQVQYAALLGGGAAVAVLNLLV